MYQNDHKLGTYVFIRRTNDLKIYISYVFSYEYKYSRILNFSCIFDHFLITQTHLVNELARLSVDGFIVS